MYVCMYVCILRIYAIEDETLQSFIQGGATSALFRVCVEKVCQSLSPRSPYYTGSLAQNDHSINPTENIQLGFCSHFSHASFDIFIYICTKQTHSQLRNCDAFFSFSEGCNMGSLFFFCYINIICISVYVECVLAFVPMSLYVIYCEGVRFFRLIFHYK